MDPASKNENLGFIRLFVSINLTTDAEEVAASPEEKKQKSSNTELWSGVLTVTLLEGNNLPAMDQNGGCGR